MIGVGVGGRLEGMQGQRNISQVPEKVVDSNTRLALATNDG